MRRVWFFVAIAICAVCVPAVAQTANVCLKKNSNADIYRCFEKAQLKVNAEVDTLANNIVASLRKDALDLKPIGPAESTSTKKAASGVLQSQGTWKAYREQHCRAVVAAYGGGSGAGIAYEECLLRVGKARLSELRSAFQ